MTLGSPPGTDVERNGGPTYVPDADQLDRIRALAEAETGMDLAGDRSQRLRIAADRTCHTLGLRSSLDLERILAEPERRGPFLERLASELTIGETFFFRNEHHFRALRERVVPAILESNRAQREIRIWSAGCATGEEPYSLAILLDRMPELQDGWRVSILATDLNPGFLEQARQACYRPWSFRGTDIHRNLAYFRPEGDAFRLDPRIRERVHFSYLNLVRDVYPSPLTGTLGLDLILFRNVSIYLKKEVTEAILDRMYDALRPGGWLLMSETEILPMEARGFASRRFEEATLYQKETTRNAGPARGAGVSHAGPILFPAPEFSAGRRPAAILVPPVPEWVPLPVFDSAPVPAGEIPAVAGEAPAPYRALSGSGTGPAPSSLWERVRNCLGRRAFAEAEEAIQRISDRRERAALGLRYAESLLGRAEVVRARAALEACLREEPLSIEAHLLKACFAQEAGDLRGAEEACRRALYVDRTCAMAHFRMALLQQERGSVDSARRSLDNVLSLTRRRPADAPAEYGEGLSCGRLREMATALLARSATGDD